MILRIQLDVMIDCTAWSFRRYTHRHGCDRFVLYSFEVKLRYDKSATFFRPSRGLLPDIEAGAEDL